MRKVSSPTSSTVSLNGHYQATGSGFGVSKYWKVFGVAAVSLTLFCGQFGAASAEDNLEESRKEVQAAIVEAKKEISSAKQEVNSAKKIVTSAKKEVETAETEVKSAVTRLEESNALLRQAQVELATLQSQLIAAQEEQARIDAEHVAAQEAVTVAKAEVEVAIAEVDAQKVLIGIAARNAYQQQTDLIKFSIVFESESMANLASRLQWSETIFDSTAAQLDRLTQLQSELEAKQVALTMAEAQVALKAQEAANQVAAVQKLTDEAAVQAATVSALVASNEEAKAAAAAELEKSQDALKKDVQELKKNESELEMTKAQYKKLQKAEAKIAAKIRAEMLKDDGAAWSTASTTGFVYPVHAKPGSPFGMRYHPILHYSRMHWGLDFGASCGAPLYAMADGKVTSAAWQSTGLGYYTMINYGTVNGKNITSGYAHQSKLGVKAGQMVKQGEVVGYVGTTGLSTGCHLHLQIYESGNRVNPMKYLK